MEEFENDKNKKKKPIYLNRGSSKTHVGVLLFFLGVIGLIIGLLLYPFGTYERQTFLKGWLCTLISIIIFCVVAGLIALISGAIAGASQAT